MDNIIICKEILEHNLKYLDRVSFHKSNLEKTKLSAYISFKKDDMEVSKYFYGNDLNELKDQIIQYISKEIKL